MVDRTYGGVDRRKRTENSAVRLVIPRTVILLVLPESLGVNFWSPHG